MFKICLEPESPNQGPCLRFMLNRNRQMRRCGSERDLEPEPPVAKKGPCFMCLNRNRQTRGLRCMTNLCRARRGGVFKIISLEPQSPDQGSCARFMLSRSLENEGVWLRYMLNISK